MSAGVGTGRPGEEYRRSIGRGSDTDKHPPALVAADDEPVDAEIVSESDQQTYAHPDGHQMTAIGSQTTTRTRESTLWQAMTTHSGHRHRPIS